MSDTVTSRLKVVEEPVQTEIRRFESPDIDRHGMWLVPRLKQAYPHLNDRAVLSWLRSMLANNELMFLYHEFAVGLVQVESSHTLAPKPIAREHFVWCKDKTQAAHVAAAACMYDRFAIWAKGKGCEVMVVEENTDVPHEAIKERLGRVFSRQQQFARL